MLETLPSSHHKSWLLLLLGVVFAISHTWSPLYYSNQNQYFVHGLAQAGVGKLKSDWLATTKDPTPIFSMFVEGIFPIFGEVGFQLFFALMLVIYFTSVMWLLDGVFPRLSKRNWLLIGGVFIALHSAILRFLIAKCVALDVLWYFQCGVAGQYVLGPGLQPSVFGVFLITAIAAYANNRVMTAILCSSLAAILHATYLLPAALFTLGVMYDQNRRGFSLQSFLFGLLALVIVLPSLSYIWITFKPIDPQTFEIAQNILVNVRIPHHARVDCWLEIVALMQLLWIGIGIFFLRQSRIATLLTVMAGEAVILTVIQWLSKDPSLALLFPWRMSAILMPIATAVIISAGVNYVPNRFHRSIAVLLSSISFIGGLFVFLSSAGYAINKAEQGIIDHIRKTHRADQQYLLPVRMPNIVFERTLSQSLTFNARPRPAHVISWDFQRFRLASGARTYVDFKSIPYADVDVVEWYRRMQKAERWFKDDEWNTEQRSFELDREKITHVIVPADLQLPAKRFQREYSDANYLLYRVIQNSR